MIDPKKIRFRAVAFVCGKGCVREPKVEGWATFYQLFDARPNDCRFLVVESAVDTDRYAVWDLYADDIVMGFFNDVPPPACMVGDSADALVMKAMALYEKAA